MVPARQSLCTIILAVTTAFALMVLAGVLEVSLSVQPPTWMLRRRPLHDSHHVKAHVQSMSSALDVQPADGMFSRRKLQVS